MKLKHFILIVVLCVLLINCFAITIVAGSLYSYIPATSINMQSDPLNMSDEAFFGKWDNTKQEWMSVYNYRLASYSKIPELRYHEYPQMSEVEKYAKLGDYNNAKIELRNYYRTRSIKRMPMGRDFNLSRNYYWKDFAMNQLVYGTASSYTELTVTGTEEKWYSVNIPVEAITIKRAFILMAIDKDWKDGSDVLFDSRDNQSQRGAYLDVYSTNGNFRIDVKADTYIQAGVMADTSFLKDPYLKLREEGNPLSDYTKRTYLYFDYDGKNLSGLTGATLYLYGKREKPGSTRIMVGTNPPMAATAFSTIYHNSSYTWNTDYTEQFNFNDGMYNRRGNFQWIDQANSTSEYPNGNFRFQTMPTLVDYYINTKDEKYAEVCVDMMMTYLHTRREFASRPLDYNWRLDSVVTGFFGCLDSEAMTPEVCTAWLKFFSVAADLTEVSSNPTASNQATVKATGHMALALFLPEVMPVTPARASGVASPFARTGNGGDYYQMAYDNTLLVFRDSVVNNDYAYKEGVVSGYIYTAYGDMVRVAQKYYWRFGKQFGDVDGKEVRAQMVGLSKYIMKNQFPNGQNPRIGDGDNNKGYNTVNDIALMFSKDEPESFPEGSEERRVAMEGKQLLWYVTEGKDGKQYERPSSITKSTGMTMMKTSFHNINSVALSTNAYSGATHFHNDDLSVEVYGYGRMLLSDGGQRSYDSSPQGIYPSITTRHSTISIDGRADTVTVNKTGTQGEKAGHIYWASNDLTDFLNQKTDVDPEFNTNRKILFIKPLKYFIVSDYSAYKPDNKNTNNKIHEYIQAWTPELGWAPDDLGDYWQTSLDSKFYKEKQNPNNDPYKRLLTNYSSGGNLQIIPADCETFDRVKVLDPRKATIDTNGKANYNNEYAFWYKQPSPILWYVKKDKSIVDAPVNTFDTVLYPIPDGQTADVRVERLPIGVNQNVASALKIHINERNTGFYYVLNTENNVLRNFGDYLTNGSCAYVNVYKPNENSSFVNHMSLINGDLIADSNGVALLKTSDIVHDVSVLFEGDILTISSSFEDEPTPVNNLISDFGNKGNGIKIYINTNRDYEKVVLNGKEVIAQRDGDYLVVTNIVE